jgi:hypothetical protein
MHEVYGCKQFDRCFEDNIQSSETMGQSFVLNSKLENIFPNNLINHLHSDNYCVILTAFCPKMFDTFQSRSKEILR